MGVFSSFLGHLFNLSFKLVNCCNVMVNLLIILVAVNSKFLFNFF